MGAWQKLYNTYEACKADVGKYRAKQRPLLPICHVTMEADIEIVIDSNGNIKDASVILNRENATTIIPSTEDSASRVGSKPVGHVLADKLQYLAGDYVECGGKVQKGFAKKDASEPYRNYVKDLARWCDSEYSHPKAEAVLKYVSKGVLVKDLERFGVFHLGSDGKFVSKKDAKRNKDTKDIFAIRNKQEEAVIRWIVETDANPESRTWHDPSLWKSWQDYYLSTKLKERFCYITGEAAILSRKHPKFIRTKNDNAKLISSDDDKDFTYRGRFKDDKEACSLSLEASQKAHYALIWLIDRQGKVFYEKDDTGKLNPALTVVAWEKFGREVPQPNQELPDLLYGDLTSDEAESPEAGQRYSVLLGQKMSGYAADLKDAQEVCILALNSLSKGRSAITYYQEFEPRQYLKNIETWHQECAWHHTYRREKDPITGVFKKLPFTGAPAPIHIAEAAYGENVAPKIKYNTATRLLPCIVEACPLPRDIVESVVRRASNRRGIYEKGDNERFGDDEYTWHKTLSIACALFRKFTLENRKERYQMTLDLNCTTRDYLYGRLLAIADAAEERALYKAKEKRSTNAARYMQQFSQRPFRTWKQIHDMLIPYFLRLGSEAYFYKKHIAEVSTKFADQEFQNDDPLTGEYLLGYYCQWSELDQAKRKKKNSDTSNTKDAPSHEEGTNGDIEDDDESLDE